VAIYEARRRQTEREELQFEREVFRVALETKRAQQEGRE
jgi:hypothetical protein